MKMLLVSLLLLANDVGSRVELDPAELERAAVEVREVESGDARHQVRVVGEIVRSPGATHPVRSLVEGRIEKIDVAPGDRVRPGQELLVMHSHTLHQLQAELLQSIQELRLAENRAEAGRQLLEIEGISRMEVERREQEAFSAQLAVETVKVELNDLGFTPEQIADLADVERTHPDTHPDLVVRAPVGGVVLELPVSPQSWVQPWEPLLLIGNPERLELALQLTPDAASTVRPGDRVEFHPVGQPECQCSARVVTQVPQVDPETRTVTIRATVETSAEQILPGVFVEGHLIASSEAAANPMVPESAVTRYQAADHVFVETAPGTFEPRAVRLGRWHDGRYEVLSGVAVGERIAVDGVFLLKSKLVRGEEG